MHGVCAPRRGAAMAASASPPPRARLAAAALLLATVGALLPSAHGGAPTMWLQGLLEIDPLVRLRLLLRLMRACAPARHFSEVL